MKNRGLKIFASAIFLFILAVPSYSKNVYVLCYHAFLDRKDPYSFTENQFREQLRKLKSSGFTFVTFDDIINNRITGDNNILISIDDGNKSVYQAYYSVMKPMGIKPLLGIYPAIISRMHYAMTWEQLNRLAKDGCYIASHGYHHMFLSEKYYKQDQASFKKEIYLSKKILEEKLNRKIETMVYPFGLTSDIAVSELKNAGYKYALTIIPKMTQVPANNNFQIPRFLMTKPGQKGVIARILKNAVNQKNENIQAVNNTSENSNSQNQKGKDKISIIDYPARIKKFMINDIIFMPEYKGKKKKEQVKFKPFIDTSTLAEPMKKNRKISVKDEKKKSTGKENIVDQEQKSKLYELKKMYYTILSKWTVFVLFIKEKARVNLEIVRAKTSRLFS